MTTTKPRPNQVSRPWVCMRTGCNCRYTNEEALFLMGRCERQFGKLGTHCGGYLTRVSAE